MSFVQYAAVLNADSYGLRQLIASIPQLTLWGGRMSPSHLISTFEHVGVPHMTCFVSQTTMYLLQANIHEINTTECAIVYETSIRHFVAANYRIIGSFDLSDDDWKDIKLIAGWLQMFRLATAQMSATSIPMISTAHAVFRGLQDQLKHILVSLPNNISPSIHSGILSAHRKLSDYFTKFDESPYYTWAASTLSSFTNFNL